MPSDRLFSSAGNLVNQKRSCLSPENVDYLLFLYENSKVLTIKFCFTYLFYIFVLSTPLLWNVRCKNNILT